MGAFLEPDFLRLVVGIAWGILLAAGIIFLFAAVLASDDGETVAGALILVIAFVLGSLGLIAWVLI